VIFLIYRSYKTSNLHPVKIYCNCWLTNGMPYTFVGMFIIHMSTNLTFLVIINTCWILWPRNFYVVQQPKSGQDRLIIEVSRSHTVVTHTHPVGLLWTSDRLVADVASYTTNSKHKRTCPQWDSNPRTQQWSGRRHTA